MGKNPNLIDQYVGSRVKARRNALRFSQSKLAAAVDISFQQIQKYEKGTNRIGASRLQAIAKFLQTTPSYFFEGAPMPDHALEVGFAEGKEENSSADFLATTEGRMLVESFCTITDTNVRKRLLDLMTALAQAIAQGQARAPSPPPVPGPGDRSI